jgi:hypothetical protein
MNDGEVREIPNNHYDENWGKELRSMYFPLDFVSEDYMQSLEIIDLCYWKGKDENNGVWIAVTN